MIHNKDSISNQIIDRSVQLHNWVEAQTDTSFSVGPEGKWTTGQHLEHLISSVVPLNQAFMLPRFVFRLMFGKPNRPPRKYDAVVDRYKEKLNKGGQATGSFVPSQVSAEEKELLLRRFFREYKKLSRLTLKWSDSQLDNYLLPHPLLGKVTIREMLFFTVYHLQHHLEILNEQYEQ
jgi:hypothetical protein